MSNALPSRRSKTAIIQMFIDGWSDLLTFQRLTFDIWAHDRFDPLVFARWVASKINATEVGPAEMRGVHYFAGVRLSDKQSDARTFAEYAHEAAGYHSHIIPNVMEAHRRCIACNHEETMLVEKGVDVSIAWAMAVGAACSTIEPAYYDIAAVLTHDSDFETAFVGVHDRVKKVVLLTWESDLLLQRLRMNSDVRINLFDGMAEFAYPQGFKTKDGVFVTAAEIEVLRVMREIVRERGKPPIGKPVEPILLSEISTAIFVPNNQGPEQRASMVMSLIRKDVLMTDAVDGTEKDLRVYVPSVRW